MKENRTNRPSSANNIPELDIIDLDDTSREDAAESVITNHPTENFEEVTLADKTPSEEAEDFEEEYEEEKPHKSPLHLLFHIGFLLLVVLIIVLAVQRIRNFGNKVNLDDYEGNLDAEVLDYMMPLIVKDDTEIIDDGETTIVLFGNSPLADDRDSANGLASMIAEKTGASITAYTCFKSFKN
jgi:hypothetical protein